MRWARHVARGGVRNTYDILVGKPEGKTSLGRPILIWGWIILEWILGK